ncbi:MAG: CoB--CoM heterodisulfide reductase iron-sulfur subunit B family protein [Candidatus Altiarchaeota archaeon]|nr:CoB--CoM heterodisulfide reductase iron-sulfur subunit B family protein [Candidatus Altiarchaeota archaeon]
MSDRYAYFIGCTTPSRVPNYDLSTRRVMEKLDIELVDMNDGGCCGFYYEVINELTYLSMAARVLSMAEDEKLDLMVVCNGCNGSLVRANRKLKENPELKEEVNNVLADIDREFKGTIEVKHYVRVLWEDVGVEKIKEKVSNPLDVKVAVHYGCHLLRPSDAIRFDDAGDPVSLDELVCATGANSIDYLEKSLCCGGYVLASNQDVAHKMTGRKLRNVKKAKADLMITACPFCNVMYDANQKSIERELEEEFKIPVLHYPQLLGISMGYSPKEVGLEQNRVRVNPKIFE